MDSTEEMQKIPEAFRDLFTFKYTPGTTKGYLIEICPAADWLLRQLVCNPSSRYREWPDLDGEYMRHVLESTRNYIRRDHAHANNTVATDYDMYARLDLDEEKCCLAVQHFDLHTWQSPLIRCDGTQVKISCFWNKKDYLRDRRVLVSPEKYATQMLDFTEAEARVFGSTIKQELIPPEYELKFARSIKDIQKVYANGPNSCMANGDFAENDWYYDYDKHIQNWEEMQDEVRSPVAVYCSPDIAVAYIGGIARPLGRAVVNLRNKTYARAYGRLRSINSALDAAGFEHNRYALDGCSILHISVYGPGGDWCRLQPYIDKATRYNTGEYCSDGQLCTRDYQEMKRVVILPDGSLEWATASTPEEEIRMLPFREIDDDGGSMSNHEYGIMYEDTCLWEDREHDEDCNDDY